MNRTELIAKAQYAILHGGKAVITGAWVWVSFDNKPGKETREALKAEGFKWAPKKGKWYFAGKPASNKRGMSWSYIVSKYGEEVLI